MKTFKTVLFSIIIFGVGSCKKEPYPESSEGDPVFYFNANIDGIPYYLKAGENNYYLYSSYSHDTNNVYNFIGAFKQKDCSTCGNSIEIQINDTKTSLPGSAVMIDEALKLGNYDYYPGATSLAFNTQFNSYFTGDSSLLWDFGDGSTSTIQNPSHLYSTPGIYQVCLTVGDSNSCFNSICNVFNLIDSVSTFRVLLNLQPLPNGWVSFTPQLIGGTGPYNYFWDFGDGTTSDIDAGVIKAFASQGLYVVTLRVVDGQGDTAIATVNAPTDAYTDCVVNFSMVYVSPQFIPNIGLSGVTINWTDPSGKTFTSKNIASQPPGSYFHVVSQETFKKNEQGETTRKLHVKFSCTLYNGNESIQLADADAVIAIAYK